ncbi:Protein of unknown function [Pyronema omphalodes CBS 100304]|uniref:Uncharacterized protein n=1 Tax=Pyronema omphalodes (strain CBS 100304) TaxID=1076935 RepID=U4KWJ9_PYROM|nr:Protein of unknown function [Pyronema omphalodes CBS 100304]
MSRPDRIESTYPALLVSPLESQPLPSPPSGLKGRTASPVKTLPVTTFHHERIILTCICSLGWQAGTHVQQFILFTAVVSVAFYSVFEFAYIFHA